MANRIFYAVQQVAIGPDAADTFQVVKGVQSVSMTTTFNLEQAFELGQLEIYENIEGVPNIEMTVNRLMDGTALLYVLASATQNSDAYTRADDINLASQNQSVIKLGIWDEAVNSYAERLCLMLLILWVLMVTSLKKYHLQLLIKHGIQAIVPLVIGPNH
jgi:hypothetical protein